MTALQHLLYWRLPLLLASFVFFGKTALAYNQAICCEIAQNQSAFVDLVFPRVNCRAKYDASKPPSPKAHVSYGFCKDNCGGIGRSQANEPGQWAAPLVQFILPSVIFAMTIPRMRHIDFDFVDNSNPSWRWVLVSLLKQLLAAALLFMDTTIWIGAIVIDAAPMMVSGLYEALLDRRVLCWLDKKRHDLEERDSLEFLVTVVCGNIHLDLDHQSDIELQGAREYGTGGGVGERSSAESRVRLTRTPERAICHAIQANPLAELTNELICAPRNQRQEKLRDVMDSQMGFGSIVGAPVLFYLGAFVYTILDLRNDQSDQDAAISLAFGVEWMIIPHVAIVAGCLLASNNPSTAAAIVGLPPSPKSRKWYMELVGWKDAYETRYQPVYMWDRGRNKMRWVKSCNNWNENGECREHFNIKRWQWILFIYLPTFSLISLPALAGAFVAYGTPPIGWGCRSLTFMVYAGSQILLALIAVIQTIMQHDADPEKLPKRSRWRRWLLFTLKSALMFCSLVSAIGGTLMQIIGVFRNCICYVNAGSWLDIYSGKIDVASDTSEQRNSSNNWIVMGSFATGFMGFCCYIGWWYTRHIRKRFREEVQRWTD